MPQQQSVLANFVAGATAVAAAAETVVATTRQVSSQYAGASFAVKFNLWFTAGAAATSVSIQVRRNGLTGTSILSNSAEVNPGLNKLYVVSIVDGGISGESAGAVWVMTMLQVGTGAAGSVINAYTEVITPV